MYIFRGKLYKRQMALGGGWSCRAGTDWGQTGDWHQLRAGRRAETGIIWDSSLLSIPAIITTPRQEAISEALDINKQLSFMPAPLTCL